MKTKESLFWIIITALVVGALILSASLPKEKPMAIDFEASTGDQYIDFGDMASLKSMGTMTICAWIKAETSNPYAHIFDINTRVPASASFNGGYALQLDDASGQIRFVSGWSTNLGGWDSNTSITPGNNELVCASYNSNSTANDPIFYLNGYAVAITEISTPAGSLVDYSPTPNTRIGFGFVSDTATRFDGLIRKILVYNRILTAAEILEMYNSKGLDYPRNGLVFCPVLHGAKGLQAFDGATLAAGNLIVDPCSGATGTPTGSPVGVGETYLSIK